MLLSRLIMAWMINFASSLLSCKFVIVAFPLCFTPCSNQFCIGAVLLLVDMYESTNNDFGIARNNAQLRLLGIIRRSLKRHRQLPKLNSVLYLTHPCPYAGARSLLGNRAVEFNLIPVSKGKDVAESSNMVPPEETSEPMDLLIFCTPGEQSSYATVCLEPDDQRRCV